MWKNIRNVVKAATDVARIVSQEVSYQATKASDATETVTSKLAEKSSSMRARYEQDLADRKAGIKKPTVVEEAEVPNTVVAVN